jgi:glycosyltransferase involved in cell wall biosynthesis
VKGSGGATRTPVSAVVLTFNEAKNIERCLQSVAGWCQELHVVDSGSTDDTVEIARRYTDLVHVHPYVDHASQWAWVLDELPLACEWLLLLDADNVVTDELKEQIGAALAGPDSATRDGYYSVHRHLFRGRQVRGLKLWWLRLVRHRRIEIDHSELVDFRLIVHGPVGYLPGAIVESNEKENDIDFWIDKHQKFAARMAVEEVLRREGYTDWSFTPRLLGNPDERMTWLKSRWYQMPLFARPFLYFFYRYVIKMGVLDGQNGFVYHFLQAFWFRLLVDIRMSDIYRQLQTGDASLMGLAAQFGHTFDRVPRGPGGSRSAPVGNAMHLPG